MEALARNPAPSQGSALGASSWEAGEDEPLYPEDASSPSRYIPPQVPGADVALAPPHSHAHSLSTTNGNTAHAVERAQLIGQQRSSNGCSNGAGAPTGLTGRKGTARELRATANGVEDVGGSSAAGVPLQQASFSSRATVLLLLLVLAGVGSMIVTHESGENVAELRGEVQRLQAHNEDLEERARLARQEQQDLAKLVLDPQAKKRISGMLQRSKAFDTFIQKNGFASKASNTNSVRNCLGRILHDFNIESVLDVPCGDGGWQHLIPGIENVTYVGADINIKALETAKHRETNSDMEYMLFDSVHFPLQRSFDLILLRDAVEKQRVQDTLTAVLNFKTSNSKYIAATFWPHSKQDVNEGAYDLADAGWYEANLIEKPFSFPAPIATCENDDPGGAHRGKQYLGIWRLKDLPITAETVQAAAPERHAPLQFGEQAPTHGEQDMTLEDLLGHIGAMYPSNRRHEDRQTNPFDGLFNDFLGTPGMVRHRSAPKSEAQLEKPRQRRRVVLPTELFQHPEFFPTHEMMR